MRLRFVILIGVLLALAGCAVLGGAAAPTPTLIPFTPGVEEPTAEAPTSTVQSVAAAPSATTGAAVEAPTTAPSHTPAPTDTPLPLPTPSQIAPTDAPPPQEPAQIEGDGALDSLWGQLGGLPPGLPFSVTITEAQIETAIAEGMAQSGYGASISGYDVSLQNGQIGLSFRYTMPAPISRTYTGTMVYTVSIDSDGSIRVSVVSASLSGQAGSIELPPELAAGLNQVIEGALNEASQYNENVTFTSISIASGEMVIAGYVSQ